MVDSVSVTNTNVTPVTSTVAPGAPTTVEAAANFQTVLDQTSQATTASTRALAAEAMGEGSSIAWLASAEEPKADVGTSYLLSIDTTVTNYTTGGSHRFRPTIAEFMDRSGADFQTAADLLAGVVGANQDPRDWTAIMAASSPLQAAREATGQMINSVSHLEFNRTVLDKLGYTRPDASKIVAQSGNFAVIDKGNTPSGQPNLTVTVVDALGQPVGNDLGWDAPSIVKAAQTYNLDLSTLNGLADKLDAKGILYEPYELYHNTGSDAGVDLRDLARGGLGTAYDWRSLDDVGLKGDLAAAQSVRRAALAEEMKLTLNKTVTTGGGVNAEKVGALKVGDETLNNVVVSNGSAVWLATLEAAQDYAATNGGTVKATQ